MAILDTSEFRLVLAILLNGAIFWTSHRLLGLLARPRDRIDHAIDLILWWAAIITILITGLGWLGRLDLVSIVVVVVAITVLVSVVTNRNRAEIPNCLEEPSTEPWGLRPSLVIGLFAASTVAMAVYISCVRPASATDALIYHLATPARWIQDGRLSIAPLWFHNPANSYSPLHGSCLFAWLMLPMGNDVFARFGQVPLLLLCGFCIHRMLTRAGVSPVIATSVAAACCLSRSFLSEGIQTKDDIILTGYFLAAMTTLDHDRLTDLRGVIRLGLAVGLMLATKYTSVLVLPAVGVVAIPALARSDIRRRLAWSLIIAVVLAGPWYLRNLIATGNPVFPIDVRIGTWSVFSGVFTTCVAPEHRTLGSLIGVLVGATRFSVNWWLMLVLAAGWAIAWWTCRHRYRQPIVLAALIGPALLIATFHLVSPFREVRFLFPAIGLFFVATGLAIGRLPGPKWVRWTLSGGLLVSALISSSSARVLPEILVGASGLTVAILLGQFVWYRWCAERRPMRLVACAVVAVLAVSLVYVNWDNYIHRCRSDYRFLWSAIYRGSGLGPAWAWLDENAEPGDVIAYTGTPMTYPLLGQTFDRHAVYVPIQPGIEDFRDLPRIDEPLSGHQTISRTIECYRKRPDKAYWLAGLAKRRVRYLLITPLGGRIPIEAQWAKGHANLQLAFESGPTRVYRISEKHDPS